MKCKRGGPCHIRSVCMGLSASTAVIIVGENNSCTECPGKQEGSISEKEQSQSWLMKVFFLGRSRNMGWFLCEAQSHLEVYLLCLYICIDLACIKII